MADSFPKMPPIVARPFASLSKAEQRTFVRKLFGDSKAGREAARRYTDATTRKKR
jgi:hypothetical protein